jgi:hypothetical protein
MPTRERYLARAQEIDALAARAADPAAQAEWRNIAASYRQLAETAQSHSPEMAVSTEHRNTLLNLTRELERITNQKKGV